mmetsp:Transcript_45193/g.133803  ORF Transcript_45193/g.133803 Transcript_45193/m.133803 type:complete len:329 (+) Transcript_45193:210-1196(+)
MSLSLGRCSWQVLWVSWLRARGGRRRSGSDWYAANAAALASWLSLKSMNVFFTSMSREGSASVSGLTSDMSCGASGAAPPSKCTDLTLGGRLAARSSSPFSLASSAWARLSRAIARRVAARPSAAGGSEGKKDLFLAGSERNDAPFSSSPSSASASMNVFLTRKAAGIGTCESSSSSMLPPGACGCGQGESYSLGPGCLIAAVSFICCLRLSRTRAAPSSFVWGEPGCGMASGQACGMARGIPCGMACHTGSILGRLSCDRGCPVCIMAGHMVGRLSCEMVDGPDCIMAGHGRLSCERFCCPPEEVCESVWPMAGSQSCDGACCPGHS